MKNEDLTKMSLEELRKREKSAHFSTALLIGIVSVQCVTGIYLTIVQGFSVFTIMPAVFLPIVIISYSNLKRIKEAIASRSN